MKIHEILGRGTAFSGMVMVEYWKGLTVSEKIELLGADGMKISAGIAELASVDENAVVRMFAVEHGVQPKDDDVPIVRYARCGSLARIRRVSANELSGMSMTERIVALATGKIEGGEFVQFLRAALSTNGISEGEAAAYALEYVRNPISAEAFFREPFDGMDWSSDSRNFKAVWEFVCDAPEFVASHIAQYFPLETSWKLRCSLSPDLLSRIPEIALCALVKRGFEPLLNQIQSSPNAFSEAVRDCLKE